mmetsp:Transcript_49578/g.50386  ORF Transcript_49578/g.50386 Transcript_49578/m.50386 type:complete len:136 (+) Transcript_49578:837-1244(+)
MCAFDFVFGEFHSWFAPILPSPGHRIPLDTVKALQEYEWALTTMMNSSRNCQVRWLNIDDESYLHDGQPLPTGTHDSTGTGSGIVTGNSHNGSAQRRFPSSSKSQSQVPHPLENLTSLPNDTNNHNKNDDDDEND